MDFSCGVTGPLSLSQWGRKSWRESMMDTWALGKAGNEQTRQCGGRAWAETLRTESRNAGIAWKSVHRSRMNHCQLDLSSGSELTYVKWRDKTTWLPSIIIPDTSTSPSSPTSPHHQSSLSWEKEEKKSHITEYQKHSCLTMGGNIRRLNSNSSQRSGTSTMWQAVHTSYSLTGQQSERSEQRRRSSSRMTCSLLRWHTVQHQSQNSGQAQPNSPSIVGWGRPYLLSQGHSPHALSAGMTLKNAMKHSNAARNKTTTATTEFTLYQKSSPGIQSSWSVRGRRDGSSLQQCAGWAHQDPTSSRQPPEAAGGAVANTPVSRPDPPHSLIQHRNQIQLLMQIHLPPDDGLDPVTTAVPVQSVPDPGGTYRTRCGRSINKPERFREE